MKYKDLRHIRVNSTSLPDSIDHYELLLTIETRIECHTIDTLASAAASTKMLSEALREFADRLTAGAGLPYYSVLPQGPSSTSWQEDHEIFEDDRAAAIHIMGDDIPF